jgi:hypothetical protein
VITSPEYELIRNSRYEHRDGRDYLVAPLVMIVSGVLSGSRGPLLYPIEELQRTAELWNSVPILLGHHAASPEAIARYGLGTIRNARVIRDKLVADGWFDVEAVSRLSPTLLDTLVSGGVVELSTGLSIDADPTEGIVNGVYYHAIARQYRPDHLAILIDQRGACSINDGCGVHAR